MEIRTVCGVEIYILPECAVCKMSGKNPMYMTECPEGRDVCCPDDCLNYDEVWEGAEHEKAN